MKVAYMERAFKVRSKLVSMKWMGEQIDDYASEIRRLVALAGFSSEAMERIVRLVFVTGFPDHISISLQQQLGIHTMPGSELIEQTCIMM